MMSLSSNLCTRYGIILNKEAKIIANKFIKTHLAPPASLSSSSTCIIHRLSSSNRINIKATLDTNSFTRRRVRLSFPSLRGQLFNKEMHSNVTNSTSSSSPCIHFAAIFMVAGLLVCYNNSSRAEAPSSIEDDNSSSSDSHGKEVHKDYSIIGIPGDGRCLFRAVVYGACLRSGKPAPFEDLQRQLADELRSNVADEFVARRQETEWFIEGDFDTYVERVRKPHVWGGEPELLMASHVLRMPITVYMYDDETRGLISIAEYGKEYGEGNPIRVLYHGFGHYDALQLPSRRVPMSKL